MLLSSAALAGTTAQPVATTGFGAEWGSASPSAGIAFVPQARDIPRIHQYGQRVRAMFHRTEEGAREQNVCVLVVA